MRCCRLNLSWHDFKLPSRIVNTATLCYIYSYIYYILSCIWKWFCTLLVQSINIKYRQYQLLVWVILYTGSKQINPSGLPFYCTKCTVIDPLFPFNVYYVPPYAVLWLCLVSWIKYIYQLSVGYGLTCNRYTNCNTARLWWLCGFPFRFFTWQEAFVFIYKSHIICESTTWSIMPISTLRRMSMQLSLHTNITILLRNRYVTFCNVAHEIGYWG